MATLPYRQAALARFELPNVRPYRIRDEFINTP
jgi:hypothetical protein